MKKYIKVTFPDHSEWHIPEEVVVKHHANLHKHHFDGDMEKAIEFTRSMETKNPNLIMEWVEECMSWKDVEDHVVMIEPPLENLYDFYWDEADKEIIGG